MRLSHPAAFRSQARKVLAAAGCLLAVSACRAEPAGPTPDAVLSDLERQGQAVFTLHCAPCHALAPGTVIAGPSLAGIANLAGERVPGMTAESYIRRSILSPYDYLVEGFLETMPPDLGKRLTGEEFDAVVAFLLTLD